MLRCWVSLMLAAQWSESMCDRWPADGSRVGLSDWSALHRHLIPGAVLYKVPWPLDLDLSLESSEVNHWDPS